jgi:hypothetical protein
MFEPIYYGTRPDGVRLVIRKSDLGVKLRKKGTNDLYNDAIDIEGCACEYEETDIPVDKLLEEEDNEQ